MLIGREAQLYLDFGKWQGYRKSCIKNKVEETDYIYSFYLVPADGKCLPPF
ncbi:hypothetical protein NW756_006209 [Fusarium oxysporum]|nr:hypothetical protein NW753_007994 [Fusarium oxysporum]KAJ4049577.1 hypothetical protein NW763_008875 [Fusarium oxysporum]KAJ4081982.1 hypothetical protein NW769_014820 [Fusarium oxysporum]KAJ4089873.1 hypothetical protein NW756_006209 [Fusarium oxysporum]KAJ4235416.1 hypothetical protein NW760_004957 [Fusarium oxysporum]